MIFLGWRNDGVLRSGAFGKVCLDVGQRGAINDRLGDVELWKLGDWDDECALKDEILVLSLVPKSCVVRWSCG